ncbi:MAG: prepilin-type N-terminal cleavage/methylation domain-containing protein [Solirubrobacteraceae bacterium]
MRRLSAIFQLRRDQRGFTLVETLVAMLSATVVVGALYAILIISVDQTSKVTDTVHASQVGRTTMTKIVEELHSACIAAKFVPVKMGTEKVKGTEKEEEEARLLFVNAYSSNAEIGFENALEHEIVWQKSTGLLIQNTYKSNGGTWPEFAYPETHTTTRLGENITQTIIPPEGTKKKEYVPIFRYYKYPTESTKVSSESALDTLQPLELETKGTEKVLNKTELEQAAAVEISFNQAPLDKNIKEDRTVDLKDQVTLAFSAPNAETPIEDKPCE